MPPPQAPDHGPAISAIISQGITARDLASLTGKPLHMVEAALGTIAPVRGQQSRTRVYDCWQALAARHFVPAGGKGDALEQLALGAQAGGGVGGGQCAVLGVGRGGAAWLQAEAEQQGERRQHQHPAQQGGTVDGCANDGILAFFVHVHRSFLP